MTAWLSWALPVLVLALALVATVAAQAVSVQGRRMAAARSAECGGPYVCPFPPAAEHRRGDRWTCPSCDSRYVLTGPQAISGHGYWRLAVPRLRELLGAQGDAWRR